MMIKVGKEYFFYKMVSCKQMILSIIMLSQTNKPFQITLQRKLAFDSIIRLCALSIFILFLQKYFII